jgi:hypothetical protein
MNCLPFFCNKPQLWDLDPVTPSPVARGSYCGSQHGFQVQSTHSLASTLFLFLNITPFPRVHAAPQEEKPQPVESFPEVFYSEELSIKGFLELRTSCAPRTKFWYVPQRIFFTYTTCQ